MDSLWIFRFNLDPFGMYSDQQLWDALEDAHIKAYLSSNALGLSAVVEEGGKNFSVGQRQLLSLARAIVRRSRVVLMDEVTASIDYVTDQLIQSTIRTSDALKHATIITVAHRLRTIADSDLIVVINAGECVEQGNPSELLKQSDSYFRKLALESNEYEDILRIASTDYCSRQI
jgi:ABC-type multidrug transport system fused ATPase/permease subunit